MSRVVRPRAEVNGLVATWVGHSTFLLQIGGLNVLTDPMWSERASPASFVGPRRQLPPGLAFDTLPSIDAVLLSHDHYDHLDQPTVRRIASSHPGARWFVPLGVARTVRRWGPRDITELDWWQQTSFAGLHLACTPARHFSGRGLRDRNHSLWCGWCIQSTGRRVFFAGDTAMHPEFRKITERFGPFDLALIPIGAYAPRWFMRPVHMDPSEAIQAYLATRAVSPAGHSSTMGSMHWGTFKLADEPLDEPPIRIRAEWEGAGLADGELWLPAPGESREFR
jgi:N-acyl-phosphatidylethanolamine-hydrolysing phospholipase D